MTENICVICHYTSACHISDSHNSCIVLTIKGQETLLRFSSLRGDADLTKYLNECKSNDIDVSVHQLCRRNYTDAKRLNKRSTDSDENNAGLFNKKLRSSLPIFEWKTTCFLCGFKCTEDAKHPQRNETVYSVRTLSFHNTIIAACADRGDQWSQEIRDRLLNYIDLVAEEAIYHKSCLSRLMSGRQVSSTSELHPSVAGRSVDCDLMEHFNRLCDWIENEASVEPYSVSELHSKMLELSNQSEVYSMKRLKQKLSNHYGEHIYFAEVAGKCDVMCFQNMANYILSETWYNDRKDNISDESERIIIAAAKLIKADIMQCQYSSEEYPTNDDISNHERGLQILPHTLRILMRNLLSSELKQKSIGQCILRASKQRVIPPILFGLGVEVDHVFGSRWLIDELYSLGFSISYDEVRRYKQSVIQDETRDDLLSAYMPGCFTQWVADNVDHNIATLDGHGTFHGMGILAASAPSDVSDATVVNEHPVKRHSIILGKALVQDRGVPIIPYIRPDMSGLALIQFRPFIELQVPYTLPPSIYSDMLWQSGWMFRDSARPRPNWSGFMQDVTTGPHSPPADVLILPIIDLNPSDETCLYSTLIFIESHAKKLNIVTPCITFDQALWIKAIDIVKAKSMNIVCRLGGFHMMMSFLGSIGVLMNGGGLSDVLETSYGSNAVTHMMTGKAIARAIRGHFLVDSALNMKLLRAIVPDDSLTPVDNKCADEQLLNESIFDTVSASSESTADNDLDEPCSCAPPESLTDNIAQMESCEIEEIKSLYEKLCEHDIGTDDIGESKALLKLIECLNTYKDQLSGESRTARLWLQYMSYIDVLKLFIRAERTGDWNLHLVAVSRMLNLFAATGHNNYAKSARIYLQMMLALPTDHPWLYKMFATNGYHTIRRSDRFWAGLWTDLIIEQVMMRAIKSRGGLTRGRGMTEAVRLLWVYSMHKCAGVHNAMTNLTQHQHVTSEQHTDLSKSSSTRDYIAVSKMLEWFNVYNPFDMQQGLIASTSDNINCDTVECVGHAINVKLDNSLLMNVTMKKADQVRTLVSLQKSVKVGEQSFHLDSTMLFWRLIVLIERCDNMEQYFQYELAPIPTALFKDAKMRKPTKSILAEQLTSSLVQPISPNETTYVIDGGALLHRVRWQPNTTYAKIFQQYVTFVRAKYGVDCYIVFDGYCNGPSTKDHEHQRRCVKTAPDVKIESSMPAHNSQHVFLNNTRNKSQFIQHLSQALTLEGHDVRTANADADTVIVDVALSISKERNVTVVADDTDILVLLLHHFQSDLHDVLLRSDVVSGKCKRIKLCNIRDCKNEIGNVVSDNILFIHAWGGCDTTSCTYGHGKTSIIKRLKQSEQVRSDSSIISQYDSTADEVARAGCRLFVFMCGGKPSDTLTQLRYTHFMKFSADRAKFRPEKLPPTEASAVQHAFRVHLQVIQWKTLLTDNLQPTEWGWNLKGTTLVPTMTTKDAGPPDILNIIRCKCKSTSRNQCSGNVCSCRKNGLQCVTACGECHGTECHNTGDIIYSDADD